MYSNIIEKLLIKFSLACKWEICLLHIARLIKGQMEPSNVVYLSLQSLYLLGSSK